MVCEAIAKGDVAALNYFIADKYIKAFGAARQFAEPEDHHAADRGDEHPRLAGRHRRDRQGHLRRKRGLGAGRGAPASVPSAGTGRSRRRARVEPMTELFDLARHLELADLRPRPDGAGTARARRLPVLARACGAAGRAVVVRGPSVLADAAPDVRGLCRCAVPLWRRIARGNSAASDSNPFLNKRADALVGRVFTLDKPIIDGAGTVRIDDTDLARRRSGRARRQPRQDRAGRRRQPDGGGGADRSTLSADCSPDRPEISVCSIVRRKRCSGRNVSFSSLPVAVSRYPPTGTSSTKPASRSSDSRACSTVGEASSQAARSAREVSGSSRSSQRIRKRPAPAQQVEQHHDRPAGFRTAHAAFCHALTSVSASPLPCVLLHIM